MYQADLNHSNKALQAKLEQLYGLGRGTALDLSFRPPFLNLLEKFGNPHLDLPPVIHVAGTNGKGSTIAMMRSILEAAGYKVHVYTSPHLLRFNERIVLAGEMISNTALESLIDEAIALNNGAQITFFEITTAMAFAAFSRMPADVVLMEVGLGGRLDCTNIIPKPAVSVISAISYDHTQFLGETLQEIAREKGGIIKDNIPCIIAPQPELRDSQSQKSALDMIEDIARDKNAPLYRAGHEWAIEPCRGGFLWRFGDNQTELPAPALPGQHQLGNAGAALTALHIMQGILPLAHHHTAEGLQKVKWPGRLEHIASYDIPALNLPDGWELWYDGGHNDSAGLALAAQASDWADKSPKDLHIVLGMKADKDPKAFLEPLLPYARSLSIIHIDDIGPCVTAGQVSHYAAEMPLTFYAQQDSIPSAIQQVLNDFHDQAGRILICGSLYLAEKIEMLKS